MLLLPGACDDPGLHPDNFLNRCTTMVGTPAPYWADLIGSEPVDSGLISLAIALLLAVGVWFLVKLLQRQIEEQS